MSLIKQEITNNLEKFNVHQIIQRTKYIEEPVYILQGHTDSGNEVHFSPNGNLIASTSSEVMLWSIDRNITSIGSLKNHKNSITSFNWFFDTSKFITSSADKTLALQDTETGNIIHRYKSHKEIINVVRFFPDEQQNLFISGDDNGEIYIHDIRTKEHVACRKSNSPVTDISVKGLKIAIGGICGNIFIDRLDGNKIPLDIRIDSNDAVFGLSFDGTGQYLCSLSMTGVISMIDVRLSADNRYLSQYRITEYVEEVIPTRVHWVGNFIATGSYDSCLKVFNAENPANIYLHFSLPGHQGTVTGVSIHPTKPIVASISTHNEVIVGELSV